MNETAPPELPPPPCAHSGIVIAELRMVRSEVGEIRAALVGNQSLGHKGLVRRVDLVEATVERHDRRLLVWGSIIAVVGSAGGFAAQIIFR